MTSHTTITAAPNALTVDLDKLDPLHALYLIDRLSEAFDDPDPFIEACQQAAWTIAGEGLHEGNDAWQTRQEAMAEQLYPPAGSPPAVWREFNAQRDSKLRQWGFVA